MYSEYHMHVAHMHEIHRDACIYVVLACVLGVRFVAMGSEYRSMWTVPEIGCVTIMIVRMLQGAAAICFNLLGYHGARTHIRVMPSIMPLICNG